MGEQRFLRWKDLKRDKYLQERLRAAADHWKTIRGRLPPTFDEFFRRGIFHDEVITRIDHDRRAKSLVIETEQYLLEVRDAL